MTNINKAVLIGRLTRDCVKMETRTGKPMALFTIAVRRDHKQNGEWQEKPNYISIAVYGVRSTSIYERLKKGELIALEGHMESYPNDEGKTQIIVVCEKLEFLSMKRTDVIAERFEEDSAFEEEIKGVV